MRKTYRLIYDSKPFTINQERRLHYHVRSRIVKVWREAFAGLALKGKIPRLTDTVITSQAFLRGRRRIDVDAPSPSLKAAVDGLRDSGVLEDDNYPHVKKVVYLYPVMESEKDQYIVDIEGEICK